MNTYSVTWDGKDDLGREVSSGVYIYKIQSGGFQAAKKLVLVR